MWIFFLASCKSQSIGSVGTVLSKKSWTNFRIPDYDDVLVKATCNVINNFFASATSKISFFRESKDQETHIFDSGFINEVLYNVHLETLVQLEDYKALRNYSDDCGAELTSCNIEHPRREYNLFFINDYATFRKIYEKMNPEEFSYPGYYLIVLTKFKNKFGIDVSTIFEDMWSEGILNANILLKPDESNREVQMLTYNPFQYSSCGSPRAFVINFFRNESFIWKGLYFQEKDKNLHSCPLVITTFKSPPYMMIEEMPDGSFFTDGVDGTILRVLSQKMNFSVNLQIPEDGKGAIYSNGTSTGAMKLVAENMAELVIGYMAKTATGNKYMADSYFYTESKQVWVIPPGQSLTSIGKLLQPFKIILWIFTSLVLMTSLMVIFVLKFSSKVTRNFLFGKGIHYPAMNLINTTFGGSMPKTPTRNFARFLLMVYILFCLVIRNAYQGALFNFLARNSTFMGVDSLKEMLEANFTFYILDSSIFLIADLPAILERYLKFLMDLA